jgi:ABC-type nickel/cobalt efflux system permease component RcnA
MNELIAILFRFINFFVIVGIGIVIFKKYFLEELQEGKRQEEAHTQDLEQEQRTLESKVYILDAQRVQQRVYGDTLKEKVATWQKAMEQEHAHHLQEKEERSHECEVVLQKQYEQLKADALKQQVLPRALAQVRTELAASYADPLKGRRALEKIVAHIEKEQG